MNKYLSFCETIVKIGPVYPEIIGLQEIVKKEINASSSKVYSLPGKFSRRDI